MRRDLALAATLAALVPLSHARAQGLQPAYGTDIRVGDLRTQFARAFAENPPTASERVWNFTPAIDVSETYDSAVRLGTRFGKDFITRITPTFAGTVDSQRITGAINYSPSFNFYAIHGSQNGVNHNLNATTTATLVKDLLFLDLRGYAATQPAYGGLATPGGSAGGSQNEVQTASFSISPYLQHRFSDLASLYVGYTATRSIVSSLAGKGTTPLVAGLNSNYTSQQEHASLATGPDFGRISASLNAMATQYAGSGLYQGAHNETYGIATGYAITRMVTLTAGVGHETIIYGPGGPKAIDGITWNGGVRLTPNADSVITASYGHQEGGTSFAFDGTYAATARIRIMARYSQGIGTALQNLQNAIAGSTVGPAGIAVDRTTGAPVQLGNFLGQQPGVYRTTSASISAVLQLDRDTVTVSVDQTDRQQLSGGTGPGIGSNSGISNSLAWQHSLSEDLTTTAYVQYATRSVPGLGDQATKSVTLSVNYALSRTLSANALLSYTQTSGNSFGQPPTREIAVVGLHKAF